MSVAALAFLAAGCGSSDDSATTDAPATTPATTAPAAGADGSPDGSTDGSTDSPAGTYTADGEYDNPDGSTSVAVEVTLDANGVIEDVAVTPHATGGNSALFQKMFADNIAESVVGQPIEDVKVDKIAGSSLTGAGFNAALGSIIDQAGL